MQHLSQNLSPIFSYKECLSVRIPAVWIVTLCSCALIQMSQKEDTEDLFSVSMNWELFVELKRKNKLYDPWKQG